MIKLIGCLDIVDYMNKRNVVIIDIRDKEDYNQLHLTGAKNISYENVLKNPSILNKSKTVVIYCDRGNLSLKLAIKLSRMNYNVVSLVGGFEGLKDYYCNNY